MIFGCLARGTLRGHVRLEDDARIHPQTDCPGQGVSVQWTRDERPLRFRRLQSIDPRWVDVTLAGFAVVLIAISMVTQANSQYKEMSPLVGTILSATGLALLLRRSHPLTGLVLAGLPVAIFTLLDFDVAGASAALLLSVYAVGAYGKRVHSLLGLAYVLGIILVLWLVGTPQFDSGQALQNWAVFTAAWMFGESMATRRKYLASLEERAALLEVERERKAHQAVIDERRRIAQELHDVVAHAMSVIAVQAGVGAHVIDSNPDEARKSLAAIEATSREALQEMRRMLGVLREEGDAKGLLTSAPSQVELDQLIANIEAAGVPVTLRYEGDFPSDIPESVRLNGFRVLQEALTNVVKHAGKGVGDRDRSGAVRASAWIEVLDDGRGISGEPSLDGTGVGLTGMRERVALFGGRLEAGPRPGGGFRRRRRGFRLSWRRVRAFGSRSRPHDPAGGGCRTTRPSCARGSGCSSTPRRTSRSSARRPTADEAVQVTLRTRPDVVLMDVRMPVFDGIEATRRIIAADLATKVLILTTFDLDEYVYEGLRAGASGFLLKDTPPAQLLDGVRLVAAGEALLAPSVTRRLVEEFAHRPEPRSNASIDLRGR